MEIRKCGAFANPLECVQVKAASGGRQWRRRGGRLVRVIDTHRVEARTAFYQSQ